MEEASMQVFEKLIRREEKLSVIGLGYVGLPLAVAFAEKVPVIAYDCDGEKISRYRRGSDPADQVGDEAVSRTTAEFTADDDRLREAVFHIVAVPTPVRQDCTPDLSLLVEASRTLGRKLRRGSVVMYESTVYPGVTEEVCIPILEQESGLRCGTEFKVGYSPERINTGDRAHSLSKVVKVVSGMDNDTLDLAEAVYKLVAEAGVYRAESIRVAEAEKIIENCQRDVNIAFMNEMAMLLHTMGISTQSVLKAAGTKWNFLPFQPGLVGGHCVGVDSYYLLSQAERLGCACPLLRTGRRINEQAGAYVAQETVRALSLANIRLCGAKIGVLGITFKENCTDIRNSQVAEMVRSWQSYGLVPLVSDPGAEPEAVREAYGIALVPEHELRDLDAVVIAVGHDRYRALTPEELDRMYRTDPNQEKVLIDVKAVLDQGHFEQVGYRYWSF